MKKLILSLTCAAAASALAAEKSFDFPRTAIAHRFDFERGWGFGPYPAAGKENL